MGVLLPHHAKLIADSAISDHVARARGYWSCRAKSGLRDIAYALSQQKLFPALVIPIWDVNGNLVLHQIRPDKPRFGMKDGKPKPNPNKYETPAGATMVLDVHPFVRDQLSDPTIPLWITEGSRKADAAVTAGFCCVGLLGVEMWGSKKNGPYRCWDQMVLRDRNVYVAFDSDVMTKPAVKGALDRFTAFLCSRGARVHLVYLPHGENGAKVGLDDYLAAGHTVEELRALARPAGHVPMQGNLFTQASGERGEPGNLAVYLPTDPLVAWPEENKREEWTGNPWTRPLDLGEEDRTAYCMKVHLTGRTGRGEVYCGPPRPCRDLRCRDCAPRELTSLLEHFANILPQLPVVWISDVDDFDNARKNLAKRASREAKALGMPVPYAAFRTHGGKATVIAVASLAGEDHERGEMISGVDAYNLLRGGALQVGVLTNWPSFNEGGWELRKGQKPKSDEDMDLGAKSYGPRSKADFKERDKRYVGTVQEILRQGNALLQAFGVTPPYAYRNSEEWLVPNVSGESRSTCAPPSELAELLNAILDEEFLSSDGGVRYT